MRAEGKEKKKHVVVKRKQTNTQINKQENRKQEQQVWQTLCNVRLAPKDNSEIEKEKVNGGPTFTVF